MPSSNNDLKYRYELKKKQSTVIPHLRYRRVVGCYRRKLSNCENTWSGCSQHQKLENQCNINGEWCKWKSVIFNRNYRLSLVIGYWLLVFHPTFLSSQSTVIPDRRSLAQSSRPLSQKSIKIRKYTIRAVRNTKKYANRPNSDGER